MSNVFTELKRFREDRELDKYVFDMKTYLKKDTEEGLEIIGYPDYICDKFSEEYANKFLSIGDSLHKSKIDTRTETKIDGLCDRIVFAIEAIEQLGYNAEVALSEVAKEINSRDGEIINGKFQKYKTPEAMSKWYKANFTRAKHGHKEVL